MSKTSWLLGFLLPCLLVSFARADGIPVTPDRKGVNVESFTIPLNKEQLEQVEQRRRVTLTIKQMAPLWAIYNNVPPSMDVLSSRYDSCTCGIGIYAIWCKPGEIEIPRHAIDSQKENDSYKRKYPDDENEPGSDTGSEPYESRSLILDSAGAIYLEGKVIQESETLALLDAMYERRKMNERLRLFLSLDTPPPSNETTDTRIRELAGRLAAYCEDRTISFWALGISK